jgi:FMN reductase [NAD(P)H]
MNHELESIFKHQSIRRYKNQPLEQEKLELIIKAAQAAPSWCNGQNVSIVAVKDQDRKNRLQKCCYDQPYVGGCSVFLVFCADYYRTHLVFEKFGEKKRGEDYIKELDTLVIASHDAGIAMQNALVAAESMGLGTVPIGGIRINSLEVVKELNLPKYVIPIVGLCVGYPDDNPGLKPRLPMKAVYFEENYDTSRVEEAIQDYDKTYQKYLSERSSNFRDGNWSKSVYGAFTQDIPNQDYELLKQQGFIEIEKK